MRPELQRAKRWAEEAQDLLNDLPEPNCSDADKVATIANALQLSVAAIIEAVDALSNGEVGVDEAVQRG